MRAIMRPGIASAILSFGEGRKIVMRASLLLLASLTVLSIAPAKAEPLRCNVMNWPAFSAVPCRNFAKFPNYAACAQRVVELGWRSNDVWWYCSNLGLKD